MRALPCRSCKRVPTSTFKGVCTGRSSRAITTTRMPESAARSRGPTIALRARAGSIARPSWTASSSWPTCGLRTSTAVSTRTFFGRCSPGSRRATRRGSGSSFTTTDHLRPEVPRGGLTAPRPRLCSTSNQSSPSRRRLTAGTRTGAPPRAQNPSELPSDPSEARALRRLARDHRARRRVRILRVRAHA